MNIRMFSLLKSSNVQVLLLCISSAVTMAVPYCVGQLIDIITTANGNVKDNLVSFCYVLIAIFAIGALANCGRVYLMNMSSYRIVNSLRKKTYSGILQQEVGFFDRTSTGELVNRLSADAATVGTAITNNVSDGLRSFISFIAGSSLMIYTSPHLALLGLITVAPVAVIAVIFGRVLKRNSKAVQDALAGATQVAEERIGNIRTVQAFNKICEEISLYNAKLGNVLNFASTDAKVRAVFFGFTGFSGNLIILSVLYYGGLMMSEGTISVGNLSAFLMYAAYVGISIGGLSTFYSELMKGLGASTGLWALVDRKPVISLQGGTALSSIKGDIMFEHVSFQYPCRSDSSVLDDFDLSIPAGSVYALVGASGSGKSTVASLLLRFYDCSTGKITLDGNDLKVLDLKWLRENIGVVSQEPTLFSFSIRENILYGALENRKYDDADIERALEKANALKFVKRFPCGLDTVVGERGAMLSGGQRQRIAIARALLKDPKILILDEATSALDAESEYLVQKALDDLMKDRTVITIAHRLSTIKNADVIVVLENGKVVEKGNYLELVSKTGHFHRLVQHQNLIS
ncbi:ATP-binding cassette sub-family B member 10, mitochondrial-like [Uloborus diversus]|uniref:ATP-binding cassette sub-family B member 10, mitochondrial-like n=1 Tax=Uloborus diversus TaxID=327109 RepID=UPI0024091DD4|nr:ATP-binding cassette sub-family B member 10, mitochondrial-like [Uloborus diversus]